MVLRTQAEDIAQEAVKNSNIVEVIEKLLLTIEELKNSIVSKEVLLAAVMEERDDLVQAKDTIYKELEQSHTEIERLQRQINKTLI